MRILINDFENTKEHYTNTFGSFGYEDNELIFTHSFETSRNFIETHLEKKQLHIDLIITNDSKEISNNVLKAHELCFYKNSLATSFSKNNFRICSIPTILYSQNETKSSEFQSNFNSIVKKNEYGEDKYFITECERVIRDWRKLLWSDLENLEVKLEQLSQFVNSNYFKNYYFKKVSMNVDHYFINKTKIVSKEFIKLPSSLLNYDWIALTNNEIERAILKYIDTYKNHVKYDRKNNERTILHDFFRKHRTILLRDTYSDMEYELNLNELKAKNSEECDFILKTEYPDFLKTTFFEVKKEDVTFYVKKNTKRPQFSAEFTSHLHQIYGYKEYTDNPNYRVELETKLYPTHNFDFVLLAGRFEEKEEMKHLFKTHVNRMYEGVNVVTYEELEEVNINYLEKFNRLMK